MNEGVLPWFGQLENYNIAEREYIGMCAGSRSVGRPWKRWIGTVKDYLIKRFECQAS